MKHHIELVEGQLKAYNNFDLEKFSSFYHQEIQVFFLLENKLISTGMNEFKASYSKLFKHYPNQRCILKSRIINDDSIVDEEMILGRSEHPDGLKAVAIYAFRDGLIDRVWFI